MLYRASSEANGWKLSGELGVGSGKLLYRGSSEANGWKLSGELGVGSCFI